MSKDATFEQGLGQSTCAVLVWGRLLLAMSTYNSLIDWFLDDRKDVGESRVRDYKGKDALVNL